MSTHEDRQTQSSWRKNFPPSHGRSKSRTIPNGSVVRGRASHDLCPDLITWRNIAVMLIDGLLEIRCNPPPCSATATAIVSAWTSRPTNFILFTRPAPYACGSVLLVYRFAA